MNAKNRIQTFMLLSISVLGQFSIAVINFGIIFFLRQRFSLSAGMIGTFAAVMTFCYFLGCLVLKRVTSHLRPRHSVEIAAGGMMLFGLLILYVPHSWMALVSFACYGVAMSFFWPPIMGWLTRGVEGRELSRTVSMFNLSWSSGLILAPYIAGLMTEVQVTVPLYAAAVTMFIILTIVFAATAAAPSLRAVSSSTAHMKEEQAQDNSTPLRYVTWAGILAGYFLFGITMNIFPIYAKEVLLYSESSIGLLLLIRALVTTISFVLLGRMVFWHFNTKVMLGIQVFLAGVCLFGIIAKSTGMLVIFFILYGIAFAVIYTNSIFHGVAGAPDRESRMAIHEATLTMGTILGSIFGGTIYQYGGYPLVLGVGIGVSLTVFLVQAVIIRKYRPVLRENPAQT